jgi:hypothetical protein
MKLSEILQEIVTELNMPTPEDAYKFNKMDSKEERGGRYYKYTFTNAIGQEMEATVMAVKHSFMPGKVFYIAFGPYNKKKGMFGYETEREYDKKYSMKTKAGDVLKVLATVVEAVKLTAEKEGGMDKVHKLAWAASDDKRQNVYDHYIGRLFPDFEKDPENKSKQYQMYVNKNFKPEEEKLQEVGEGSANPYPYTKAGGLSDLEAKYTFDTESGTKYQVVIIRVESDEDYRYGPNEWDYDIGFGVEQEPSKRQKERDPEASTRVSYNAEVNKGEMYRVMATVIATIKDELESDKKEGKVIRKLLIYPAKRRKKGGKADMTDMRRAMLYQAYISKNAPEGSKVSMDPKGKKIQVELPKEQ